MKTLIIFRHGKSDWGADYEGDHQRPISKRGRQAAKIMGRFLALTGHLPDAIVTSSARRARETVDLAYEAGSWDCPIEALDTFYEAAVENVLGRIRRQSDDCEVLLIAGHEPTWSNLISSLAGGAVRFPTGAMARLDFDIERWSEARSGQARLIWLVPPRLLTDTDIKI